MSIEHRERRAEQVRCAQLPSIDITELLGMLGCAAVELVATVIVGGAAVASVGVETAAIGS